MSSISVTPNQESPFLILSTHSIVQGKLKIGGDFGAIIVMRIYSESAIINTKFTKYSQLPLGNKKKFDNYFFLDSELDKGCDMIVSISGPILKRKKLSDDEYRKLVIQNPDERFSHYPLVRHVTQTEVIENSEDKEQFKSLIESVAKAIKFYFPNQQRQDS